MDELIVVDNLSSSFYSLTAEGESILANGSQEFAVLQALEEAGAISLPELEAKVGKAIAKIGMGNCMKKKWIKKDGGNLAPVKKTSEVTDEVQVLLKKLAEADYSKDARHQHKTWKLRFANGSLIDSAAAQERSRRPRLSLSQSQPTHAWIKALDPRRSYLVQIGANRHSDSA